MAKSRNPKFEATFELARNITIAVALGGFAYWAGFSPQLPYPEGPPDLIVILASGFSGIWIALSCERFVAIWRESGQGTSTVGGVVIGAVALAIGFGSLVATHGLAKGTAIGAACQRAAGAGGDHHQLIRSSERCARYFSELDKAELRLIFE